MKRLGTLAATLAATLGLLAGPALAGDVTQTLSNGVEVRGWSPWPAQVRSGWAPAFIELRNDGERTRQAVITAMRTEWRLKWRLESVMELKPGEARNIELLIPMAANFSNGTSLTVECDGEHAYLTGVVGSSGLMPTTGAIVFFTEREFEPGQLERWNSALGFPEGAAGASTTTAPAVTVIGGLTVHHSSTTKSPAVASIAVVRADQAPAHTAAYSSLDLVVLDSASPWPSAERFEALAAWLRVGGDVLVIGPDAERAAQRNPHLAAWMAPRFALECDASKGAAYRAALGRLFIARGITELEGESADWVRELLEKRTPIAPNDGAWRARDVRASLDIEMVPARVFAALLLLFALLIGPVNFIVVSRRKRPALLLVTIPAISLSVSVLLLAFGIFHQGLDVKSASVSLSVLDQRSHVSSSTHRRQIFAGMAPAVGLRPAAGTVAHHISLDDSNVPGMFAETALRTAQAQGWTLSGDFLPTRRLASQLLTVDRAERARLEVDFDSAEAQVTNGLGVRVEELLVRDAQGRDFRLEAPLEPGSQARLKACDAQDAQRLEVGMLARTIWLPGLSGLTRSVPPAAYLARVASGVLLDECGVETRELSGLHVVLGVLPESGEERR